MLNFLCLPIIKMASISLYKDDVAVGYQIREIQDTHVHCYSFFGQHELDIIVSSASTM